jgi:hypothetical protein
VAHLQGGRPAAVFFPLGYPTPYGPAFLALSGSSSILLLAMKGEMHSGLRSQIIRKQFLRLV